jgi:hypothetical protein
MREGGRALDRALEAAIEAKYSYEPEEGVKTLTPSDLLGRHQG